MTLEAEKTLSRLRPENTSGSPVGRGFDSPHLHHDPGFPLEARGFSLQWRGLCESTVYR